MPKPYLYAIDYGTLAGMRTFSAPAWAFRSRRFKRASLLMGAVAFEFLFDKITTQSRMAMPQLVGRVVSGALSAAVAQPGASAKGQRWALAGIVGAVAALGATVVTYRVRRFLGERTPIGDIYWGTVEDVLAYGFGSGLIARSSVFNVAAIDREAARKGFSVSEGRVGWLSKLSAAWSI